MKRSGRVACYVVAGVLMLTGCAGKSSGNPDDQTRQSETDAENEVSAETKGTESESEMPSDTKESETKCTETPSAEASTENATESGSTEDLFAGECYTGALGAWQVTGMPDSDGVYYEPYYEPLEAAMDLRLYRERSMDAGSVVMPEGSIFFAEAKDEKEWIFFREMNNAYEGWLHIVDAPHTYQFADSDGNIHDIYEAFAEDEKAFFPSWKCEADIGALLENAENCGLYYRIGFSTAGEVSRFLREYKKMLPLRLTKEMESWFNRDELTKYLFFYQTDCGGEITAKYSMKTGTLYLFSADGEKTDNADWYANIWEREEALEIERIIEYSRDGLISCR